MLRRTHHCHSGAALLAELHHKATNCDSFTMFVRQNMVNTAVFNEIIHRTIFLKGNDGILQIWLQVRDSKYLHKWLHTPLGSQHIDPDSERLTAASL